jgi:type II secretion system protein G
VAGLLASPDKISSARPAFRPDSRLNQPHSRPGTLGTGLESRAAHQEVHLMKKRNNKGFTLIELLIVVAIIGIIVAIAIPNLLNAIQRAKQKRTMGDMRSAGTAAEAYAVDFNHYPAAAGYTLPAGLTYPATATFGAPGCAAPCLNGQVTPTYIRILPLTDGWNSWFLYATDVNFQNYMVESNGKDGTAETPPWGETTNFNNDIVFVDGQFVQYPAGAQN